MSDLFEKELSAFVGKDGYDPKIALLESMLQGLHDRLTALERGGSHDKESEEWMNAPMGEPKPAPATVERYNAYQYYEWRIGGIDSENRYKREPIGEVVARFLSDDHWWVKLPNNNYEWKMNPETYRALVDMMLANKYWERTND